MEHRLFSLKTVSWFKINYLEIIGKNRNVQILILLVIKTWRNILSEWMDLLKSK